MRLLQLCRIPPQPRAVPGVGGEEPFRAGLSELLLFPCRRRLRMQTSSKLSCRSSTNGLPEAPLGIARKHIQLACLASTSRFFFHTNMDKHHNNKDQLSRPNRSKDTSMVLERYLTNSIRIRRYSQRPCQDHAHTVTTGIMQARQTPSSTTHASAPLAQQI